MGQLLDTGMAVWSEQPGRRVPWCVGSSAFCGSSTNKDDSGWELAGSTKVPEGKATYQGRTARPVREGRPGRCEAPSVGGG